MISSRVNRSYLFAPGHNAKLVDRVFTAGADAVILDLEDAVGSDRKAAARDALRSTPLDPATTIVRVNGAASGQLEADLAALAGTDYRHVMLAKAEAPEALEALAPYRVIALCESPLR